MTECCSGESSCCGTDNFSINDKISFKDILGEWKVRWGINRMNYMVEPGIYSFGDPDKNSPVLVTANYKLTFDKLRKNISGLHCWVLILDTKGVNVWCAAGKGTFSTEELINRIQITGLNEVVEHRKLILPQLSASGVNANEVKKISGFSVIYGPVRAKDIQAYINDGYNATEKMRTVKFTFFDRLVLTPIEIVSAIKTSVYVFAILFILNLYIKKPFGLFEFYAYIGALLTGAFLTPLLLPIIPGKAFSWKGFILGTIWTIFYLFINNFFSINNVLDIIGYFLLLPSISAFLAMNFTGSSTYTSFSGVTKEMKIAIPLMLISFIVGSLITIVRHIF